MMLLMSVSYFIGIPDLVDNNMLVFYFYRQLFFWYSGWQHPSLSWKVSWVGRFLSTPRRVRDWGRPSGPKRDYNSRGALSECRWRRTCLDWGHPISENLSSNVMKDWLEGQTLSNPEFSACRATNWIKDGEDKIQKQGAWNADYTSKIGVRPELARNGHSSYN